MPRRTRRAAALALALLVAACGDDDDDPTLQPDGTTQPSTPSSVIERSDTVPTTEPPAGAVVDIEVAGGEVVGGPPDIEVATGEQVTLRVTADVTDEVHVHGYDHLAEVAPDAPAELTFLADIPGQFEIELEDSHLPIANLIVS